MVAHYLPYPDREGQASWADDAKVRGGSKQHSRRTPAAVTVIARAASPPPPPEAEAQAAAAPESPARPRPATPAPASARPAPRPSLAMLHVRVAVGIIVAVATCLPVWLYFLALSWRHGRWYLLADALLFCAFAWRRAQFDAMPPKRPSAADAAAAFENFLAAADALRPRGVHARDLLASLMGCAGGAGAARAPGSGGGNGGGAAAAADRLTLDDAAELLSIMFFERSRADMAAEGLPATMANDMARRLEREWGFKFASGGGQHPPPSGGGEGGDGNNHGAAASHGASAAFWSTRGHEEHPHPQHGPVKAHWRPLWYYVGTEFIALGTHIALRICGWHRHAPLAPLGCCFYTYGPLAAAQCEAREQVPIVFCHGVGMGLAPYLPMIQRLASSGRPAVVLSYKHISMRWTRRVPTVEQAADELAAVLRRLGARQCDAVGQSFGTLFISRLIKTRPELVRTAALFDPVCCCIWTGDLARNFVHKPMGSRLGFGGWLAARDLHVAAATSRRFLWTDYNLWGERDLPADGGGPRVLLAIGGQDDFVSAPHVAATVAGEADGGGGKEKKSGGGRVSLLQDPERAHGAVVVHARWRGRCVDAALAQMAEADRTEVVEVVEEESEEEEEEQQQQQQQQQPQEQQQQQQQQRRLRPRPRPAMLTSLPPPSPAPLSPSGGASPRSIVQQYQQLQHKQQQQLQHKQQQQQQQQQQGPRRARRAAPPAVRRRFARLGRFLFLLPTRLAFLF